jgi:tRNA threonylcarbamoyladenosine biosynthesis protein TsaE
VEPPKGANTTIVTHSDAETVEAGRVLGSLAAPNDVITLSGELGAGKTCLTQGIAKGIGIVEHVPSPTFNLLLVHPGELTLYHFDLYRLRRASELEDIDLFGTVEADGVSVIEWADRFPGDMPQDRLDIVLETVGVTERRLTVVPHGARAEELAAGFAKRMGAQG